MSKILCFDMDGTLANLYSVSNWLNMLQSENTRPYEVAIPIYNMDDLTRLLKRLKQAHWKIAIITWGAKNASVRYNQKIARAKKAWLKKYKFPYDSFIFQPYGTSKNKAVHNLKGRKVLIDDNYEVLAAWPYEKINAMQDILEELQKLLKGE